MNGAMSAVVSWCCSAWMNGVMSAMVSWCCSAWMNGAMSAVVPDVVESEVGNMNRTLFKLEKGFNNVPAPKKMATKV